MSANEPPSPAELEAQLPLSAAEAQAIADAMDPLQNLASVGDALGSGLEEAPGTGTSLLGAIFQHTSAQLDMASISAETLARAIQFYIEAQTQGFETLFPPPHMAVQQFSEDIAPLAEMLEEGPPRPEF